jgi:hypothetical protein
MMYTKSYLLNCKENVMTESWKSEEANLLPLLTGFLSNQFGEAVAQAITGHDPLTASTPGMQELAAGDRFKLAHNADLAVRAFAGALGHTVFDMVAAKRLPRESELMRVAARMMDAAGDGAVNPNPDRPRIDPTVKFILSAVPR